MSASIESVPVSRSELAHALRFLAADAVEAAKLAQSARRP
jgi:hypothetical protein